MVKEESILIQENIKSESFIFLLKENIHSFAIFKDYFTEAENPNFDPSIKISKYNDLILGRSEESKEKNNSYKIDRILHENSFKYLCSPLDFISQRMDFVFSYLWREKDLWNNNASKNAKI